MVVDSLVFVEIEEPELQNSDQHAATLFPCEISLLPNTIRPPRLQRDTYSFVDLLSLLIGQPTHWIRSACRRSTCALTLLSLECVFSGCGIRRRAEGKIALRVFIQGRGVWPGWKGGVALCCHWGDFFASLRYKIECLQIVLAAEQQWENGFMWWNVLCLEVKLVLFKNASSREWGPKRGRDDGM